jgi:hypothetical protein
MSKRIVALDFETETDDYGNARPLLCCLYGERYEDTFELTVRKDYERFFRTIVLSGDRYVVFNASFDVEIIIIMLLKNGFSFLKNEQQPSHKTMKLIMGQKIYQLTTYYELAGELIETEYVDLGNLIVGATLKEIAEKFTDERKGDYEASKEDWETFKEYCMKDARITYKAYMNVIKTLGKDYLTIGSAAFDIMLQMNFNAKTKRGRMGLFRRIFGTYTVEEDNYLRKWYAGGFGWCSTDDRTETRIHSYDKISAYPWASQGKLPTLNDMVIYKGYKEPTEEYPFAFIKLRVTGQIKKDYPPVLPSRNIYGDSNIYIYDDKEVHIIQEYGKVSEYEYWLNSMEIDELEYEETILMKAAKMNPLEKFMNHYYEMKNKTTGIERDFAKRLLNSLTGKLGTNPVKQNIEFNIDDNFKLYRSDTEDVEIDTYATHVISVITSRVRCSMYEADELLRGKVKFRLYATDSVKHSTEVSKVIPEGKNMGDWKLEHEDTSFIFLGLKAYIFDANNEKGEREVMCAGISRNYKPLITNEQFFASTKVKSLISVRSGNGRILYEGYKKIASPIKKPRRREDIVSQLQSRPKKTKREKSITGIDEGSLW